MRLYAIKGRPYKETPGSTEYYCGTFTVSVIKYSIASEITFLTEGFVLEKDFLKFYRRRRLKSFNLNKQFRFKSTRYALQVIEAHNVLVSGEGDDYPMAIMSLLDKVSIWPQVRPGTQDGKLLEKHPDYYKALIDRNMLTAVETRILNVVERKAKLLVDKSIQSIHGKNYKQNYITMESLMQHPDFYDVPMHVLYYSVHNLYKKHCIVFYDKEPRYEYPEGELKQFMKYYISDINFGKHKHWFL